MFPLKLVQALATMQRVAVCALLALVAVSLGGCGHGALKPLKTCWCWLNQHNQPKVDATICWPNNGFCYVFQGAQYWKWNSANGKIFPPSDGYPAEISRWWWDISDIDAVLVWDKGWGSGYGYFFKGDQYWRWEHSSGSLSSGFPRPINGRDPVAGGINWMGVPSNIDAILTITSSNIAFFFKGDQYWMYDLTADKTVDGYPKPIAGNWPGMPTTVDAILMPNADDSKDAGYAFFILGQHVWKFDVMNNQAVDGYPKPLCDEWPCAVQLPTPVPTPAPTPVPTQPPLPCHSCGNSGPYNCYSCGENSDTCDCGDGSFAQCNCNGVNYGCAGNCHSGLTATKVMTAKRIVMDDNTKTVV